VAAAARAAARVVQVGHILRFHPVTATLRAALAGGRIGAVRYATGRFSGFKRPRSDVGVTHTDAIHYFDLFTHLLGREATKVASVQRDYLGRGLDDMSLTTVTYGDVPVIVEANYFVPGTHRECVIVGERGALVADYGASTVSLHASEHRRHQDAWEAVGAGKEDLPACGGEPLRLELGAFLAACRGRGENLVQAEAGVQALEIVEAAARSARLDRSVAIAEVR
jgi:predicted dehydrogenase